MANPEPKVCPRCGISVNNIRRHLQRKRCEEQHKRKVWK